MQKTLTAQKRRDVKGFRRRYDHGERVVYEALIAASEGGVMRLATIDFMFKESAQGELTIFPETLMCPSSCKDGSITILGEKQAINNFMKSGRRPSSPTVVGAMKELMAIAIKDKPKKVAEPMVILSMMKDGARWVENNNVCPQMQRGDRSLP